MDRLALITEMLQESPDDAFLHYAAALEHHKLGNTAEAITILTTLVKSTPDYLPSYYQLGAFLQQTGQTEAAIAAYRSGKVVAIAQNDRKTAGELNEALVMLDADEDDW